jgi:hypothetical protein
MYRTRKFDQCVSFTVHIPQGSAASPKTGPFVSRSSGWTKAVGHTPPARAFTRLASRNASRKGSLDRATIPLACARAALAVKSATCNCGKSRESSKRNPFTGRRDSRHQACDRDGGTPLHDMVIPRRFMQQFQSLLLQSERPICARFERCPCSKTSDSGKPE